jgi:hypothetical protein
MNIKFQEEENYTLAAFKDANLVRQTVLDLKQNFNRSFKYLILDFENVLEFPEEFMVELSTWNSELDAEHILLVAAAINSNTIELFDSYGVVGIPTVDESIDFVFMDQLEKELGEDIE